MDANIGRAAWHGRHFRDAFYKEQIALRLKETPPDDDKALRIALAALLVSNRSFNEWFGKEIAKKEPEKDWEGTWLDPEEAWETIRGLSPDEVQENLRQGALHVSVNDFDDIPREVYVSPATRKLLSKSFPTSFLATPYGILKVFESEFDDDNTVKVVGRTYIAKGRWIQNDKDRTSPRERRASSII